MPRSKGIDATRQDGAPAVGLLLVLAAGVIAYANSLHGPFILDDRPHILDNHDLAHPWPGAILHTTRPLVGLSLALNYAWSRFGVWSYHVVNLALHAAAAVALLELARTTLALPSMPPALRRRAAPLATVIALLWAVHPLGTAAVTYVIQRSEVMASLFAMLALTALARHAAAPRDPRWRPAVVVALALGMASKQAMVMAPALALAYDRTLLAPSWTALWRERGRLHAAAWATLLLLPLFLAWAPLEWKSTAGFGTVGVTPLRYAAAQPLALARYLGLALWPAPLVLDYGWPTPASAARWAVSLAVVVAAVATTAALIARRRKAGFLGLAPLLWLASTSSVIPTADPVFEHRMYLPLAAVIAAVVLGADALLRASPARARATAFGVTLVAVAATALTARTHERNRDYASELSIWSATVRSRPASPRPHNNLGLALAAAGRKDEALREFQEAVRLDPDFAPARINLGRMLYQQRRYDEAQVHLEQAVSLDPAGVEARTNLGLNELLMGRLDAAERDLGHVVATRPRTPEPYGGLGLVRVAQRRDAEAVPLFQKALELEPDDVIAHVQLGAAYQRLGQREPARREYRSALALDPTNTAVASALRQLDAQEP